MRLGKSRWALAAAIVVALGAVACGGSDDDGGDTPQAQVEAAFAKYSEAQRNGDVGTACSGLTPAMQEALARNKTCEAQMKQIGRFLPDDFPTPELVDVTVDGDTVTAKIRGNGLTNPDPFTFTKQQDGTWKISDAPFKDDFDGKRGYKFENGPGLVK
jgi:hypothetical protein